MGNRDRRRTDRYVRWAELRHHGAEVMWRKGRAGTRQRRYASRAESTSAQGHPTRRWRCGTAAEHTPKDRNGNPVLVQTWIRTTWRRRGRWRVVQHMVQGDLRAISRLQPNVG